MAIGYRFYKQIERPEQRIVDAIGEHFSADLADAMQKCGAMSRDIQPVWRPMPKFYGVAVTALLPTGSFSMAKLAMMHTQPGDVLVLNAFGDCTHALLGGYVARVLRIRGAKGVVVDGAVRDSQQIQEEGMPVCARGTAVIIGGLDGPGEINVPVACGGIVVNPGDIIVGDDDGIAVVPRLEAEYVLESVKRLKAHHAENETLFNRGELSEMGAVEKRMLAAGMEPIDGVYRAGRAR